MKRIIIRVSEVDVDSWAINTPEDESKWSLISHQELDLPFNTPRNIQHLMQNLASLINSRREPEK